VVRRRRRAALRQVARSPEQEKKFPVGPASAKKLGYDTREIESVCLLAARRAGPTGKVIGVDLCPEMVEKARHNAVLLRLHNVEFVNTRIESLPLPDGSVDVVISNGVFNLCPDKPGCWPRRLVFFVRAVGSRWPTSSCTMT